MYWPQERKTYLHDDVDPFPQRNGLPSVEAQSAVVVEGRIEHLYPQGVDGAIEDHPAVPFDSDWDQRQIMGTGISHDQGSKETHPYEIKHLEVMAETHLAGGSCSPKFDWLSSTRAAPPGAS